MIEFDKIVFKNFMSTGNAENVVELSAPGATLLSGSVGMGKSQVSEAICFALFGVPYRNIKKGQLVNSVNQKNCLVTLTFRADSKDVKIVRGIKPNVFEIYVDGNLVNQEAATKDYQRYLEKHILKFNFKTFTQSVLLGSSTFTSFMKLTAANRREVVEEILDIGVFSTMTKLNKEKADETKQKLVQVEADLRNKANQIESQTVLISKLSEAKQDTIDRYKKDIKENVDAIKDIKEQIHSHAVAIKELNFDSEKLREVETNIDLLTSKMYKKNAELSDKKHKISFLSDNHVCTTCAQSISEEHKSTNLKELEESVSKIQEDVTSIELLLSKLRDKQRALQELSKRVREKQTLIVSLDSQAEYLISKNKSYTASIEKIENTIDNVEEEKRKKKQYAVEAIELTGIKNDLVKQKEIQATAAALLKDGGIKTTIIKEYLPVMNKVINKYLEELDFFVKFELDENFNESIKSRHRDEFSYASFSEGEKQKLDIAILFAWRYIAKMKNSINTNILFLDEVFSNFDGDSLELVGETIENLKEETNVFVTIHRGEAIHNIFDRILEVKKVGNFSEIALLP